MTTLLITQTTYIGDNKLIGNNPNLVLLLLSRLLPGLSSVGAVTLVAIFYHWYFVIGHGLGFYLFLENFNNSTVYCIN
jgi:hypothetical protein